MLKDTSSKKAFRNEIVSLSDKEHNAKISRQSSLLKLDPFIDEQGLIRVGRRLENSTLPFEVKHPIVLTRSSQVTDLIIDAKRWQIFPKIEWSHPCPLNTV